MLEKVFLQHPGWPVVQKIAQILMSQGYQVVLAGGCVRDALLGLMAQDLDIATNATPEQVGSLFEKVLYIGKSFGVCRVVEDGLSLEVATFREESDYRDGRHPEKVVYSNLQEDAKRRDFTINAMFYDLKTKQLIDLVGGVKDLEARRLVTVGDPALRFQEDHLRVLRAARFVAQLDFTLDSAALSAMKDFVPLLKKISLERIQDEFHKAFKSARPDLFFNIIDETGILKTLMPDLNLDTNILFKENEMSSREFLKTFFLERLIAPVLGWAAFLWVRKKTGVEKTNGEEWLKGFKLSSQIILDAIHIVEFEDFLFQKTDLKQFVRLMKSGVGLYFDIFWSQVAGVYKRPKAIDIYKEFQKRYLVQGVLPQPLVNGQDLMDLGFHQGPGLGPLIEQAYHLQLENQKLSKQEILKKIKEPI